MPIHFSIGFVAESKPRRQYTTVCASAMEEVNISACLVEEVFTNSVAHAIQVINAVWERKDAQCL